MENNFLIVPSKLNRSTNLESYGLSLRSWRELTSCWRKYKRHNSEQHGTSSRLQFRESSAVSVELPTTNQGWGGNGAQELNNSGTTETLRNGIPVLSFPISTFTVSPTHCSLTALTPASVTKQNLCPLPQHSMHTAHSPYYPPLRCTVRSMEKLTVSSLIGRFKISVVCISILCYYGY